MTKRYFFKKILLPILTMATVAMAYQNCSEVKYSNNSSSRGDNRSAGSSGNGDGYGGKAQLFHAYNPKSACTQTDVNGDPLPNTSIFVYDAHAELVRQNCADINPQVVNKDDLNFQNVDSFVYLGQLFEIRPDYNDFDVVAALCPAGMNPKTNATRINLFSNSQDLTKWDVDSGLTTSLNGLLGSLPRYKIERTNPAQLEMWRRVSQLKTIEANKAYALTFAVERGSLDHARFMVWGETGGVFDVEMEIDLSTGQTQIDAIHNVINASSQIRPFANGYIVTLFFTTTITAQSGIGLFPSSITPSDPTGDLGDSIFATAGQLEEVANFCQ